MCFIFKHNKPLFIFTVNLNRNYDAASINFIRNIQVCKLAFTAQFFHSDNCNIHQGNRTFCFITIYLISYFHVTIICCLNRLIIDTRCNFNILNFCHKCCMTAMVGPISIKHLYFSYCWRTIFFLKIFLTK